jgi:hypothetical protein
MSGPGVSFKPSVRTLQDSMLLKFGNPVEAAILYDGAASELTFQATNGSGVLGDRVTLKAGTNSGAFVVNDTGNDLDVRMEGTNDANLLALDAGLNRAGIGTGSPDAKLHVHLASAGAVTAQTNSGLAVENNASVYVDELVPNTAEAGLRTGDPDDNDVGYLVYEHTTDSWKAGAGGVERVRLGPGTTVFIGDNSNVNQDQGLTIQQSTFDTEILSLKSTDVSHGMTSVAESDTYGTFTKIGGGTGGLILRASGGRRWRR